MHSVGHISTINAFPFIWQPYVFLFVSRAASHFVLFRVASPIRMSGNSSHLFQAHHPRKLIPELCRHFYDQGWFSGTGGGISIKEKSVLVYN